MLLNVHVKNLALIEEAEVYFKEGLNILSGETGAGKSIIIGSINIALGSKLPKDIVREGADYGLVELVFETESKEVEKKLYDMDIPFDEGQIIISRKIVNGRSTIKVNGQTVSATMLREITSLLIDIYGQHDHESLMSKNKHMDILDEYGAATIMPQRQKVAELYKQYKDCKSRLDEFDMDEEERNKELSFLEFQISEIEDANLKKGEDEELEEEYRKMSHNEKIVEALNTTYRAVGGSDEGSFSESVGYAIKELSMVMEYDDKMKAFYDSLMDIDSICNDLSRAVASYIDEMTFDEERIRYVSDRLDLINKLKMKYGITIELITEKLTSLKERYSKLKNAEEELAQIKEELKTIEEKLTKQCKKLTDIRMNEAKSLEKNITDALMDLNFLEVNFKVDFDKADNFTSKGMDVIQFYISTNSGEKLKPLSEVASGGELSRIMLALKTIMAGNDGIDTLIFDEIDTGISGRTAQKVSEKMKFISKNHQVMAITHLPQIAAMADNHYLIEKSVKNGKTITQINELSYEESVMELARILGGTMITDAVVNNAREMKKLAEQTK